jgi:hypothetical protein
MAQRSTRKRGIPLLASVLGNLEQKELESLPKQACPVFSSSYNQKEASFGNPLMPSILVKSCQVNRFLCNIFSHLLSILLIIYSLGQSFYRVRKKALPDYIRGQGPFEATHIYQIRAQDLIEFVLEHTSR